jgi:hypothetical protein
MMCILNIVDVLNILNHTVNGNWYMYWFPHLETGLDAVCIATEGVVLLEILKEDSRLLECDGQQSKKNLFFLDCHDCSKQLGTISPVTQHHITEDLNLWAAPLWRPQFLQVTNNTLKHHNCHCDTHARAHMYPGVISIEINVGHFTEFLCSSGAHIAVLRNHLFLCWCLVCLSPLKLLCPYVGTWLVGWVIDSFIF